MIEPCEHCEPHIIVSWEVALYVAGFPCTPYSTLGLGEMLADKNARQLFRVIGNMKEMQPAASRPDRR